MPPFEFASNINYSTKTATGYSTPRKSDYLNQLFDFFREVKPIMVLISGVRAGKSNLGTDLSLSGIL